MSIIIIHFKNHIIPNIFKMHYSENTLNSCNKNSFDSNLKLVV